MKRFTPVLIVLSLTSFVAIGQQPDAPRPPQPATPPAAKETAKDALPSGMPASPPVQDGHKWLRKFVGEWTSTNQGVGAPEAESAAGTGSMSSRMIGDYWVVNEMKGDMGGMTFTGLQTIGYDAKRKKFTATWIDSVMDYRWIYEGTLDEKANKIVFDAEGPSFTGDGAMGQYRDIYEFKSDDVIIVMSQGKNEDGEWVTFMTAEMRRKLAATGADAKKAARADEGS